MSDDAKTGEGEEYELTWKGDEKVCAWRAEEALAAGLDDQEAFTFSEARDLDIMTLRHLVERGATVDQIRGALFGAAYAASRQSRLDRAPVAG